MTFAGEFIRRAKARRKEAGLSQVEVAARMQALGHTAWYQTTVAKIEAGNRQIFLDEAVDLAGVLAVPAPLVDEALAKDLADAHRQINELTAVIDAIRATLPTPTETR